MRCTSLARLVYRVGVTLANIRGIYEKRGLTYADYIATLVKVFKSFNSSRNLTVLDIGASRGEISKLIANILGAEVIASDINLDSLKVLKNSKAPINPLLLDAHFLPFRDDILDVACLVSVLEHLTKPALCVQEVARVLRDKGLCIIQLPNLQWFIEPHTKYPILYLMPPVLKRQ